MVEQQSLPSLPPRSNNPYRNMNDSQDDRNNSQRTVWTPAALLNKYQAPPSTHIHDLRQCAAFTINTPSLINNKNTSDLILDSTLDKENQISTTTQASSQSSRFICHICHYWFHISTSHYRYTCPEPGYMTHHYHTFSLPNISTQVYQCCGCNTQVKFTLQKPILPDDLLQELSSNRPMIRTYLDTTEQKALKPTVSSTLSTCQIYIKDLLENTRRNINTQNYHFMERIGLDKTTTRLLSIIGFRYENGYFMAPAQVDNERLYMIQEELTASLLEIASTTNQRMNVSEKNCPIAAPVILNDFLGCQDSVEHGNRSSNNHGLDDYCKTLGVTSLASDELIVWAYHQLVQEQPDNLYELLGALSHITDIKGGDVLQLGVTIERSKGYFSDNDVNNAYQHFGAQKDIEDETLLAAHQYKTQDYPQQKVIHDEKLRIIGESRKSTKLLQYLEKNGSPNTQQILGNNNELNVNDLIKTSPVGLTNIGNTCYLNSLLQYYYTLLPFRNTIINKDDYVENEDKIDWQIKKIGGIEVDQKEVRRAKKFVGLLRDLFMQLGNTNATEIAPDMELAKMALLNEKEESSTVEKTGSYNTEVKDSNSSMEESVSTLVESKKESDDEGNLHGNNPVSTCETVSNDEKTQQPTSTIKSTLQQSPLPPPPVPPKKTNDMNMMMLGTQQDVTECMGNVMYLVEAALKPEETENMEQTRDMIRDLFYGKARQILSYKDTKTTKIIQKIQEEEFSHVIVDAAAGKNLYDGLNEYFFAAQVENFQGGQEAVREVSVRSFPPVLQIQVQRVQFNRVTSQVYKSHAFVQFDKTIYLDRYLDSNFETLASRRANVVHWQKKLMQCRRTIEILAEEKSTKLPIPAMLDITADILKGYKFDTPYNDSSRYEDAIIGLKKEALSASIRLEETMKKAKEYELKIKHEYDDLTDCAYVLHAVFIHQGEAEYGHYWLYILDHEKDHWWQFNDSKVTKVAESEIFKNTSGQKANPYFLVYIRKDRIDSLTSVSPVDA
ncbi:uncharacterized protein BX664DRAFT_340513 [Halteromyces radiatus]|uniref:uncharacterized protein n=1 Tax=Halteromyces radiatus TaxID=101107 RepID=UPI0022207656|nr:uncharacterized protein BX664DRAFT_340513 [Halteromyces radiatus]KAI8081488.1 hypothetical protein BX664DRAFT_340513 [Halteromyces radiatus]